MSTPKVLRKLRLTLIVAAVALLLLGIAALINIVRFSQADRLHTHTYEVLVETNYLSRTLHDMNVQAADYALTHDSEQLKSLVKSEAFYGSHYERILLLTKDNPGQQARLKQLRGAYEIWRGGYISPVKSIVPQDRFGSDSARLKLLTDLTERSRKDRIKTRAIIGEIEKTERELLVDRRKSRTRLQDATAWTLGLGIIGLALLVAVLAITLLRRMRDLSHSNTSLQNEMKQRELVQNEILESQLVFHTFMDNIPFIAFMLDAELRLLYANKPLQGRIGKPQAEIQGQTVFDWMPATVAEHLTQKDRAALAGGQPQESTECLPDPDGSMHSWLVLRFPFRNRDEAPVLGIVAIDITERIEAEEKLNQSQSNLKALIENTRDIIWSVDRNYRLITFNTVFSETVGEYAGRKPEQGDNHLGILRSPLLERWTSYYEKVFAGERLIFEIESLRNGKQVDVEISLNPIITDGEVTGATGYARDITERKKIERMKSEFVSTVSHELRTPLTSIRGSLGLLVGGVAGQVPPEAHKLMDIALTNSDRLVRLINDILDIEKIESGKMSFDLQNVQLMPLLQESLETNKAYAERLGVRYRLQSQLTEAQGEDLVVYADPHRLSQVMANLLSNAAKFSSPGDEVQVEIEWREPPAASVSAGVRPTVRVLVRDHGPGIPPEFIDRIFQKFAQADSSDTRQRGGTGLGLSISKAIIEQFEGHIDFTSAPDEGACFFFDLPVWEPQQKLEEPHATGTNPDRILICEDDPDISRLLCLMLGRVGYECTVAYSAHEARELLKHGDYAAMTLDLLLPDQNGVSLIRELREDEHTCGLPIVVVSAKAESGRDELNGDAIGVVDWLEKPIDDHRLMAAIQHAVAGSPGRKPHILHIEDDSDILHVVSAILQDTGKLDHAATLKEARQKLEHHIYDLVILDVGLPDGSGLDLLPLLRSEGKKTPVVIFSARELNLSMAETATTTLVKSRTSNDDLLKVIHDIIQNVPKKGQA